MGGSHPTITQAIKPGGIQIPPSLSPAEFIGSEVLLILHNSVSLNKASVIAGALVPVLLISHLDVATSVPARVLSFYPISSSQVFHSCLSVLKNAVHTTVCLKFLVNTPLTTDKIQIIYHAIQSPSSSF